MIDMIIYQIASYVLIDLMIEIVIKWILFYNVDINFMVIVLENGNCNNLITVYMNHINVQFVKEIIIGAKNGYFNYIINII